jgi:hypothetical protein
MRKTLGIIIKMSDRDKLICILKLILRKITGKNQGW